MTKIDWDKPVGHKGQAAEIRFKDDTWAYGVWAGAVGIWLLTTGESVEPLSSHVPDLENIPEEPEREEGWYEVLFGSAGLTFAFYRAPNWYRNDDDAHEVEDVLPVPILIGPRHYLSDEYRPADTCPPPMDGTPFEVIGERQAVSFTLDRGGSWYIGEEGDVDRKWASLDWIFNKRWRPIQP